MPDFLTRLTQRTLGLLPKVHPMLPSFYEQRNEEPSGEEQPTDVVGVGDEVERRPVWATPRTAVGRVASTPAPHPEVPTRPGQPSNASETATAETTVETTAEAPTEKRPHVEAPAATIADPGTPVLLTPPSTMPPDTAEAPGQRPALDESRANVTDAPDVFVGDEPDELLIDPTLAPAGRRAPRCAAPAREARTNMTEPLPSDAPREAEALGRRQPPTLMVGSRRDETVPVPGMRSEATPPAEPTVVRVTIGRVEVHAAEPAPRARPAAAAPALSLDDYLKQTSERS